MLRHPPPGLGNLPADSLRAAFGPRVSVVQLDVYAAQQVLYEHALRWNPPVCGEKRFNNGTNADAAISKEHFGIETRFPSWRLKTGNLCLSAIR